MKNIAIVEDENTAAELGQQFNIIRFCDGGLFFRTTKPSMPWRSGHPDAPEKRHGRRHGAAPARQNVSIIFITSLVQYALKGYEVDAVSFLVKPVSYYDFSLKFKKPLDIYLRCRWGTAPSRSAAQDGPRLWRG